LENRQKIKFDSYIPGEGLVIYHVHALVSAVGNCINCKHPQRMYPVSAGRTSQMPSDKPATYRPINSTYCPFPLHRATTTDTIHKTEFTDFTTPAMWTWSNKKVGKPISNIIHKDRLISFDFMDPAVGIDDIEMNNSFLTVTPNPANEYIDLRVASNELRVASIEFYNAVGQLVKSVPYNAEMQDNVFTQRISITDLSKGFYFINVGNQTAKLVVQ
jgi:hypothetical protein